MRVTWYCYVVTFITLIALCKRNIYFSTKVNDWLGRDIVNINLDATLAQDWDLVLLSDPLPPLTPSAGTTGSDV